MPGIDLKDDLEVTRKDTFQHADRPALQGLRQEGVVRIGKGLGTDVPCLVPAHSFQIH